MKSRAHSYSLSRAHSLTFIVTSPTSLLIPQPFRRFTHAIAHSPTLPLLHLRHSSFSKPSFASPTSQALHLTHLASRPCFVLELRKNPEKTSIRKLNRSEVEPGPAGSEVTSLPLDNSGSHIGQGSIYKTLP